MSRARNIDNIYDIQRITTSAFICLGFEKLTIFTLHRFTASKFYIFMDRNFDNIYVTHIYSFRILHIQGSKRWKYLQYSHICFGLETLKISAVQRFTTADLYMFTTRNFWQYLHYSLYTTGNCRTSRPAVFWSLKKLWPPAWESSPSSAIMQIRTLICVVRVMARYI